jgi:diamine N-acetyltransferase
MSLIAPEGDSTQVILRRVDRDNWRGVANLKVDETQREFVAEPAYYLALGCYGGLWQPLAINLGDTVIGFMMWAVDSDDGSCWLGGILIDQAYQRQGYGRQSIRAAIAMLAEEHGYKQFALSYAPENPAKDLYTSLGFLETGEREEDEVVARLSIE